jgi:hypothetical protein
MSPPTPRDPDALGAQGYREIIQVAAAVMIVVINAVAWLFAVKVRSVVRRPEVVKRRLHAF